MRASKGLASRRRRGRSGHLLAAIVLVLAVVGGALGAAGCGSVSTSTSAKLQVVAAENFWGSIAAQLGGKQVQVRSIVVNAATDPHSYEPTAKDARAMAGARLALVNGIGYDEWASRLLKANPVSGRVVLNVGDTLALKAGDNPHQWYSPSAVRRIVAQLTADYQRLEPQNAGYFAQQRHLFESSDLAQYDRLRTEIRTRYAGVPVGYSESIFAPLGEDLGLKLLTPYSFAKAIAEGSEVSATDKQTVDAQAQRREIKVWVFNTQNVTPDVQRVNEIARAQKIPIATVSETLSPASDSFERWQVTQLQRLARALREATGR